MNADPSPSQARPGRRPAMAPMNQAELRALPPLVDLMTAARALGMGRTTAYELARTGQWPTPILRVGGRFKVPTAPMLTLLELSTDPPPVVPPRPPRWYDRADLAGGVL